MTDLDHKPLVLGGLAAALECGDHETQRAVFLRLLEELAGGRYRVQTDAHKAVEFTLFHLAERGRYLFCTINYQQELPNIPLHDISIRLDLGAAQAAEVRRLPSGENLVFAQNDSGVNFVLPRLVDFEMIEVVVSLTEV